MPWECFRIQCTYPGNSLVASEPDIRLTERVKEAATLMDIKLFDHIIVCKNGYVSFAEEGLIRKE